VTPVAPAPVEQTVELAQVEEVTPAQVAESSEVHDELQSPAAPKATPDYERDIMTIARNANWPVLDLPGIQIAGNESAWSRWMWMSRPTNEQIHAVHTYLTSTPKSSEVHNELQSQPAPQADEEEETPEQHAARMDRLNAAMWADTEKNHPGCWVPTSVISYWRTQGRIYEITEQPQEPASTPASPLMVEAPRHTHKAVDFASGEVVEVVEP
ncbi:MAG: hypothetical protein ACRDHW_13700, partial [Ktedonobacteraceae bacterium]